MAQELKPRVIRADDFVARHRRRGMVFRNDEGER